MKKIDEQNINQLNSGEIIWNYPVKAKLEEHFKQETDNAIP